MAKLIMQIRCQSDFFIYLLTIVLLILDPHNGQQHYWVSLLHFVKFTYNDSIHFVLKHTLLFANIDPRPRWRMFKFPTVLNYPIVEDHLIQLQALEINISHHLSVAQSSFLGSCRSYNVI